MYGHAINIGRSIVRGNLFGLSVFQGIQPTFHQSKSRERSLERKSDRAWKDDERISQQWISLLLNLLVPNSERPGGDQRITKSIFTSYPMMTDPSMH